MYWMSHCPLGRNSSERRPSSRQSWSFEAWPVDPASSLHSLVGACLLAHDVRVLLGKGSRCMMQTCSQLGNRVPLSPFTFVILASKSVTYRLPPLAWSWLSAGASIFLPLSPISSLGGLPPPFRFFPPPDILSRPSLPCYTSSHSPLHCHFFLTPRNLLLVAPLAISFLLPPSLLGQPWEALSWILGILIGENPPIRHLLLPPPLRCAYAVPLFFVVASSLRFASLLGPSSALPTSPCFHCLPPFPFFITLLMPPSSPIFCAFPRLVPVDAPCGGLSSSPCILCFLHHFPPPFPSRTLPWFKECSHTM
jgi:hypothetical protein